MSCCGRPLPNIFSPRHPSEEIYFEIEPATIFQCLFFFTLTRMNFSETLVSGLS